MFSIKYLNQDEYSVLSPSYLQNIKVPEKALSKMLSPYGAINSLEHMYYFAELNLIKQNATLWVAELLQDRCYLNPHSYQACTKNNWRVTYQIPIAVQPSAYQRQPYAFYQNNQNNVFNTDLVCCTVVFEYTYDPLTKTYNKTGRLVTAFLRNLPF